MRGRIGAVLLVVTAVCCLAGPLRGDNPAPRPSAAELARLATELDADDYATREAAMQKLDAAGTAALPALTAAIESGSLELAVRAVALIDRMYASTRDEELVDRAEETLQALTESGNLSVAARADAAIQRSQGTVRQRRAVARLQKLGGLIEWRQLPGGNFDEQGGAIAHVVIGTKWTGGDEGLKHLHELADLRVMYVVEGTPVSDEALGELQRALPDLTLQKRGRAYLGVSGLQNPQGCQIQKVTPGSAADKAGLQEGDVMVTFDGRPVPTFEVLIEQIRQKDPGDTVVIEVLRGTETVPVKVELGEWN